MMDYRAYLSEIAKQKKIVGYADTYVPEEMILACGLHPARLMSDDTEPAVAGGYIQGFCCPYAKNLLEQAFLGRLGFLSAVMFSRYCDSLRGVYEVWKTEKQTPVVVFIRSAQVVRKEAVPYMTQELLTAFNKLAAQLGTTLDAGRLAEAITATNRKRKALLGLYELRKAGRLAVSAEEFYGHVFSSTCLTAGDFEAACGKMASAAQAAPVKDDRPAIVVSGAEMDNTRFFRLLDETGFFTASDDLAEGTRYAKDLVDESAADLEAMVAKVAERYIMKPPCSVKQPCDRRIDELMDEADGAKAAGVVFIRTPFCDSEGVEYPFIKKRLEAGKLPHIYLETDHRISNYMQLKTRLEAFREQIGGI